MSNFRVVTVSTQGEAREVMWDVTTTGTLPLLQGAVEGLVDVVALCTHLDMWVNDEGIVRGMEVNHSATDIARLCGRRDQPYYGPVVFTGGPDGEGQTLPLQPDQAAALIELVQQVQPLQTG